MIYLKSILVGIVALLVAGVLLFVGSLLYVSARHHVYPWDLSVKIHSHIPSGLIAWFIPLLIFTCAFAWEFRKVSRQAAYPRSARGNGMIYVNSVLAGLAASFALAVLEILGVVAWQNWGELSPGAAGGFFVGSMNTPLIGLIGPGPTLLIWLILSLGFYTKFRRVSGTGPSPR